MSVIRWYAGEHIAYVTDTSFAAAVESSTTAMPLSETSPPPSLTQARGGSYRRHDSREIPEKTRQPVESSDGIPTCKNQRATPLGIAPILSSLVLTCQHCSYCSHDYTVLNRKMKSETDVPSSELTVYESLQFGGLHVIRQHLEECMSLNSSDVWGVSVSTSQWSTEWRTVTINTLKRGIDEPSSELTVSDSLQFGGMHVVKPQYASEVSVTTRQWSVEVRTVGKSTGKSESDLPSSKLTVPESLQFGGMHVVKPQKYLRSHVATSQWSVEYRTVSITTVKSGYDGPSSELTVPDSLQFRGMHVVKPHITTVKSGYDGPSSELTVPDSLQFGGMHVVKP
ncbi:hypothetical protein PR048_033044 [Dryococelus australis]|uniref:Vitellogenin n=1 Tax=Dryococelus australis TaxID=614101 RepID=A0ABQ9FZ53_9NEOP|nr:hypothetical protein PR048_033044 [Dryococelus australis]